MYNQMAQMPGQSAPGYATMMTATPANTPVSGASSWSFQDLPMGMPTMSTADSFTSVASS